MRIEERVWDSRSKTAILQLLYNTFIISTYSVEKQLERMGFLSKRWFFFSSEKRPYKTTFLELQVDGKTEKSLFKVTYINIRELKNVRSLLRNLSDFSSIVTIINRWIFSKSSYLKKLMAIIKSLGKQNFVLFLIKEEDKHVLRHIQKMISILTRKSVSYELLPFSKIYNPARNYTLFNILAIVKKNIDTILLGRGINKKL